MTMLSFFFTKSLKASMISRVASTTLRAKLDASFYFHDAFLLFCDLEILIDIGYSSY